MRDESLAAVPGVAEIDLSVPLHVPGTSGSLKWWPSSQLSYTLSASVVSWGAVDGLQICAL